MFFNFSSYFFIEAYLKAQPSPEEKKLLNKYGNRFKTSTGDVVAATFVPKVMLKKEFNTPRVAQENMGFETFYVESSHKAVSNKDVSKLRSFQPIM